MADKYVGLFPSTDSLLSNMNGPIFRMEYFVPVYTSCANIKQI